MGTAPALVPRRHLAAAAQREVGEGAQRCHLRHVAVVIERHVQAQVGQAGQGAQDTPHLQAQLLRGFMGTPGHTSPLVPPQSCLSDKREAGQPCQLCQGAQAEFARPHVASWAGGEGQRLQGGELAGDALHKDRPPQGAVDAALQAGDAWGERCMRPLRPAGKGQLLEGGEGVADCCARAELQGDVDGELGDTLGVGPPGNGGVQLCSESWLSHPVLWLMRLAEAFLRQVDAGAGGAEGAPQGKADEAGALPRLADDRVEDLGGQGDQRGLLVVPPAGTVAAVSVDTSCYLEGGAMQAFA
jgi:hypothetical protein